MQFGRNGTTGRALRQRFVAAVTISSLGDGLVLVAFPLLAVRLTTDPILVSGLAFAARLPWLLIALPAGALVDRVDRRRLVMVVDGVRAVVVAGLGLGVVGGHISLDGLYVGAFLVGAGETLVSTATRAAIPDLASGADVTALNGQVYAAQTAGVQFAGPAVGGIVYSVAASVPFFGDAVSYVVSAAVMGTTLPPGGSTTDRPPTSLRADIRVGLRWFLAHRTLRWLAVVVTSFAFCQAMVLAVLVLYATRDLGLSDVGYGVFLAVAAVGDVAASLLARRMHARLGSYRTVLVAGVGAAAGYVLLGSTGVTALAVVALAFEAAASSLGNVATLSARHRIIPAERFGLVNNAFRMSVTGFIPIGALAGGVLASAIGLRATFVVAGIVQLTVVAVTSRPLRLLATAEAVIDLDLDPDPDPAEGRDVPGPVQSASD
jgi:MFS family permease